MSPLSDTRTRYDRWMASHPRESIIPDVATAYVFLAFHRLRREDLPEVATKALVAGLDTPALRQLAGLGPLELDRAPDLLERVARELEIEPVDGLGAPGRLAGAVARDVAEDRMPPWEGLTARGTRSSSSTS